MNDQPASLAEARQTINDLRARCEAERKKRLDLENRERCFRELSENIREVFWMTNSFGDTLVYISPAYENIWGQTCRSLHEDPGRRLAWVHDSDRERVLIAFKRDAADGRYDETYRIRRPDGTIRWIRDRAFPIHDEDSVLYRLAGFALDVTDQVTARDELSSLHDGITTSERLSVFAALGTGLAHDLSQPLTAARTFLALARQNVHQRAHGDLEAALGSADAELHRAIELIAHLRDFAREGRPQRAHQPLASVLDNIRELLDSSLRAHVITLHMPSAEQIAGLSIGMDGVFAQLILRNLLTNAIDALEIVDRDDREIHVKIDDRDPDFLEIAVSDNADGLVADVDPFEPFEPFKSSKSGGLGIGLAVCRSLTPQPERRSLYRRARAR